MIDAIQIRLLEALNRGLDALRGDERGQTTAEYVAVTAVGVGLAITILWGTLRTALTSAVGTIATNLANFVTDATTS